MGESTKSPGCPAGGPPPPPVTHQQPLQSKPGLASAQNYFKKEQKNTYNCVVLTPSSQKGTFSYGQRREKVTIRGSSCLWLFSYRHWWNGMWLFRWKRDSLQGICKEAYKFTSMMKTLDGDQLCLFQHDKSEASDETSKSQTQSK